MSIRAAKTLTATGGLAFGSVTGSYVSVFTSSRVAIMSINNSLDKEIFVSMDGGTTNTFRLPAGQSLLIPFLAAALEWSGTVAIKHAGAAPTSGRIDVGGINAA